MENFKGDISSSQIDVRLEKLDELWNKFSKTLVEVGVHEDFAESYENLEVKRQEFSDHYYDVKSFLMDRLSKKENVATSNFSTSRYGASMQGTLDHVCLPQITLPIFGGNDSEWLSFKELYMSLIHSKKNLSEVEKFQYLRCCLQGEPKRLIDTFSVTGGNYSVAWNLLLGYYDNTKQFKKRQARSLFQLPTIIEESSVELKALIEGYERTIRPLGQIVQPSDYKDLLLVDMIASRLDSVTRRDWEQFSVTKEQDTLEDLFEFLHRRCEYWTPYQQE